MEYGELPSRLPIRETLTARITLLAQCALLCCASAAHQHQVNTIQKLTEDYNNLKKSVDGQFSGEESRKRKEMEPSTVPAIPSVWDQLEGMCKTY